MIARLAKTSTSNRIWLCRTSRFSMASVGFYCLPGRPARNRTRLCRDYFGFTRRRNLSCLIREMFPSREGGALPPYIFSVFHNPSFILLKNPSLYLLPETGYLTLVAAGCLMRCADHLLILEPEKRRDAMSQK